LKAIHGPRGAKTSIPWNDREEDRRTVRCPNRFDRSSVPDDRGELLEKAANAAGDYCQAIEITGNNELINPTFTPPAIKPA